MWITRDAPGSPHYGCRVAARALSALIALAIVGGALTGCMPDAEPEPTAPFATEAEAFAAAEATYRAYVDALNQVDLADPETFEAVYAWTTGDANAGARESFSQMHADGWTVSGHSSIIETIPVDATLSDAVRVSVISCLNVSEVELVDDNGESMVSPDRPDVQDVLVVAVEDDASSTGLVIERLDGTEGDECTRR